MRDQTKAALSQVRKSKRKKIINSILTASFFVSVRLRIIRPRFRLTINTALIEKMISNVRTMFTRNENVRSGRRLNENQENSGRPV
jgi:hypothetical protein